MFDNVNGVDNSGLDDKLRQNLKGFNRDSLRILHPVFVDALRLLARRDHPDRKDSLLLPLAWSGPRVSPMESNAIELSDAELCVRAGQEEFGFVSQHIGA